MTRQGYPISTYLFTLVLEIVFAMIKSNKTINGQKVFEYEFLYTAYANDTTFLLQKQKSVVEVVKVLSWFSKLSG